MKLNLNEKEIEAVTESVTHWKEDIQARLEAGDKITGEWNNLSWRRGNEEVSCYAGDCPLCKLVDFDCPGCPYCIKYKATCYKDNQHWNNFVQKPTLGNCNAMIAGLEAILD